MHTDKKQTIVMVHGFRGTHHGLAKVAEELKDDYTLIIPDIPGFGEGEALEEYSLESYVSWLDRFMKKQNLSAPPILFGHSFGSIIAAAYAAQHPSSIDRLVLVNPISSSPLEGPRGILTKLALEYYKVGQILPEKAARGWLSLKPIVFIMSVAMVKTRDKELRQWIHNQHFTYFSKFHSSKTVLESFQTSVENNVCDFTEGLTMPVLLIAGEEDDIAPLSRQHALKELLPDSTLVAIPGVGHLTHYETPDQVARAVTEFTKDPRK